MDRSGVKSITMIGMLISQVIITCEIYSVTIFLFFCLNDDLRGTLESIKEVTDKLGEAFNNGTLGSGGNISAESVYYSSTGYFKPIMDLLGTTPDMYTKDNFKALAPTTITANARTSSTASGIYNQSVSSTIVFNYDNETGKVSANYPAVSDGGTNYNRCVASINNVYASGYIFSPTSSF